MSSFQVYKDEGGHWRWRLLSKNGRILADSAEGYTTHGNCLRAIGTVKEIVSDADVLTTR